MKLLQPSTKKRLSAFFSSGAVVLTLTIAAALAVLAVILYRPTAAPAYTGPIEHMTAGTVAEYSSLSIIAQQLGYFQKNGLQVTLKEYVAGPSGVADLLAGKVDVATAADFVGVINSFHHPDLRILASQLRADSFFMVSRHDHGINTPADLVGKKIGVTKNTAGEFYLGQFLIFNQTSFHKVSLTYGPPDKLVNLLENGQLDAIVTFDPHVHDLQANLGSNAQVWSVQGDVKLSTILYGKHRHNCKSD